MSIYEEDEYSDDEKRLFMAEARTDRKLKKIILKTTKSNELNWLGDIDICLCQSFTPLVSAVGLCVDRDNTEVALHWIN